MKLCIKSFAVGILAATVGTAVIGSAFAAGVIKSADFNTTKVVFDGEVLDMSQNPMLSVVKEGETNATNYMPLRGVLEQMGYLVEWSGETQTVIVTSKEVTKTSEETGNLAGMPNPWEACSERESFEYLGSKFIITPPGGYKLEEIAILSDEYVGEGERTSRYAYRNGAGDLYRVHISQEADEELMNQGTTIITDGLEVYYDKEKNQLGYMQDSYMVIIDIIGDTDVFETVGSVTIVE